MHRHRRGHGFKHREDLNFFQALISMLLKMIINAFIAEFVVGSCYYTDGFSPGTAVFSPVQKPVFPNNGGPASKPARTDVTSPYCN